MGDKITWLLGADASQVRAEMAKTVQNVNSSTAQMTSGFGRTTAAHQRFLESNNKVTNQVAGFTRSLTNARSASDILAAGLDRLENSTNLSLGKGIFLAASAVAVQQIHALHTEYKKLDAEVKKLLGNSPAALFRTSAAVEGHLNKVTESLGRLKQEAKGGMWQMIKDALGENLFTEDGELLPDSGKAGRRRAKDIASLEQKEGGLQLDIVAKRREQSDLRAAPGIESDAKAAGIKFRELNSAVHEQTQAFIELTQTLREIAKKYNDMKMERSGVTLEEAAARGSRSLQASLGYNEDWSAMDPEKFRQTQAASRALSLRAAGETQRLDLNPEGAHNLFNQAGEAADAIGSLKPSEKMASDFKGALAVSEEKLQEIATNTAKPLVNR